MGPKAGCQLAQPQALQTLPMSWDSHGCDPQGTQGTRGQGASCCLHVRCIGSPSQIFPAVTAGHRIPTAHLSAPPLFAKPRGLLAFLLPGFVPSWARVFRWVQEGSDA